MMCMGKEKPIDINSNRQKSKFSYKTLRPHHIKALERGSFMGTWPDFSVGQNEKRCLSL